MDMEFKFPEMSPEKASKFLTALSGLECGQGAEVRCKIAKNERVSVSFALATGHHIGLFFFSLNRWELSRLGMKKEFEKLKKVKK